MAEVNRRFEVMLAGRRSRELHFDQARETAQPENQAEILTR
jgi:hypothetical protein